MIERGISWRTLVLAVAAAILLPVAAQIAFSYYAYATRPEPDVPLWWARRSTRAVMAYNIAERRTALLEQLACYCGCQEFASPHRHLANCYLAPGGGYEQHASLCRICQAETFDAERWAQAGLPTEEIRRRIDATYHQVPREFGPNAQRLGDSGDSTVDGEDDE